jgi:hypothetical protein
VTNNARRLVQAVMAGLLLFALYLVRAGVGTGGDEPAGPPRGPAGASRSAPAAPTPPAPAIESGVVEAVRRRQSNVEVAAAGRVTRILSDDRAGSPHQRFIIRVSGGPTVLVAHNLDLAPRVPLAEGDSVELQGVYEWNDRGGVIHWTHRDPEGRHAPGWIRHRQRLYW